MNQGWPAAPAFASDPGGFGIEPCLYVVGCDAMQVVERILSVQAVLEE